MAGGEGPRAPLRQVSHHEKGLQHGFGRILRLVPAGAAAGFRQSHRERLASIPGRARAGVVLHHCPHVRHPQTGGGGDRQRAADAGVGGGDRAREEREVRAESSRPRRAAGPQACNLQSRCVKPDSPSPGTPWVSHYVFRHAVCSRSLHYVFFGLPFGRLIPISALSAVTTFLTVASATPDCLARSSNRTPRIWCKTVQVKCSGLLFVGTRGSSFIAFIISSSLAFTILVTASRMRFFASRALS